jgi:hypothetical protein
LRRVPKREALKAEWQTASDLLMKASDKGGLYIDMARIAMLRALSRK